MARKCFLIFLLMARSIFSVVSEEEFSTEQPEDFNGEDKPLSTVIRERNSSRPLHIKVEEPEETKDGKKKARTAVHASSNPDSRDKPSCCANRYGSSSSVRPDPGYNRLPGESGRYPSSFNERPIDRYGWQTSNRPASSGSGGGRPGIGSYNGNYGGNHQTGDRYVPRPSYGNEGATRPGAYGSFGGGYGASYGGNYGSQKPPPYGGGQGISGTLDDGDEFPGPGDYPENGPSQPGNIHAQKAIALKALAGVALIGAAAALATNPVLLPIGIISGRRKRSISDEDFEMDRILKILSSNVAKVYNNGTGSLGPISPGCVARLTCEIQKAYIADLTKVSQEEKDEYLENRLTDLIRDNILTTNAVSSSLKKLIGIAMSVGSSDKSCNIFICNFVNDKIQ